MSSTNELIDRLEIRKHSADHRRSSLWKLCLPSQHHTRPTDRYGTDWWNARALVVETATRSRHTCDWKRHEIRCCQTSSSAVAKRPRDASCLSLASLQYVAASSASDVTLRTLFCSVFVVVMHAAGCDKSLMRRRRCTADCSSCCSQVQHVIDRYSQASYRRRSRFVPSTPAFDAPVRGVPVGLLPWRLIWKN